MPFFAAAASSVPVRLMTPTVAIRAAVGKISLVFLFIIVSKNGLCLKVVNRSISTSSMDLNSLQKNYHLRSLFPLSAPTVISSRIGE